MGVCLETWRASIGCFVQPKTRTKYRPPVLMTTASHFRAVSWAILIAGALIMAGDVELNPGPPGPPGPTPSSSKQGQSRPRGGMETRQTKLSFRDGAEDTNIIQRLVSLEEKVLTLERENNWLKNKLDAMENQSRRNNLLIYGLPEEGKESWEQSEEKVMTFIKDELKIDCEISVERAHRLGKKKKSPDNTEQEDHESQVMTEKDDKNTNEKTEESESGSEATGGLPRSKVEVTQPRPRPVIVKFTTWKDREKVWSAGRENLRDKKEIGVGEDYSDRVRAIRKQLIPHLIKFRKQLINTTEKVFLRYDKLIVGNDIYTYDEVNHTLSKMDRTPQT